MAVSSVAFTVFPLSLVVGLSRLAVAVDKARVARHAHRDTCVAEEHYPFGGGRPIFQGRANQFVFGRDPEFALRYGGESRD